MRVQDLPSSTNIERGEPYSPPKSQLDAFASQMQTLDKWFSRPQLTQEQLNYLSKNFPEHLSTAPIGTRPSDLPRFPTTNLMPQLPYGHFLPPTADSAQWQNTLPNVPDNNMSFRGTIWDWWPTDKVPVPTGMIRDQVGTTLNSLPGGQ